MINLFKKVRIRKSKFKTIATLMVFLLVLNACTTEEPVPPIGDITEEEALQIELDFSEIIWQNQNIQNYTFTLQITCFCLQEYTQPKRVVVENNRVVSVEGEAIEELNDSSFRTIDGFFDYIRETLNQNPEIKTITYDSNMGYPTYIYFDISSMIADEEIGYTISDLVLSE